ncbi:hypothetical protein [Campylobacter ureolyticus]|uniref:Transmembrane protein n=1 Tax=Campylobacter ureolyticus TaxID=827 RepID=A0A9Q4KJ01_9BACT|nr:hypothetical protein [Campylobacter ureolyticus]MCZ6159012.1 hypothetical protein [Campylobacter ureolyticus]
MSGERFFNTLAVLSWVIFILWYIFGLMAGDMLEPNDKEGTMIIKWSYCFIATITVLLLYFITKPAELPVEKSIFKKIMPILFSLSVIVKFILICAFIVVVFIFFADGSNDKEYLDLVFSTGLFFLLEGVIFFILTLCLTILQYLNTGTAEWIGK